MSSIAAVFGVDRSDAPGLAACVALCEAAGLVPNAFTSDAIADWYVDLEKPENNPPGWVFGPVWTVLYAAMGLALFLVVRDRRDARGFMAVGLFALQLGLNVAWTFVFFGGRSLYGGLAVILMLLPAVALTTIAFLLVKPRAGLLLLPYLAWTAFAATLNRDLARSN